MDTQTLETGTWSRARCPARVRPTCQICSQAIGAGSVIAVLPGQAVRHWNCHTETTTEDFATQAARYFQSQGRDPRRVLAEHARAWGER